MLRQPAVADRFYPGSPRRLRAALAGFLAEADAPKQPARAVVSPHAGYPYSGNLAGRTIGAVRVPETVVILGPNHHGRGAPVALSTADWKTPLGTVPAAHDTAEALLAASEFITVDESAHRFEHSLEVQVPFLQVCQPRLRLVPIVLAHIDYRLCENVAAALAVVIAASATEILILASTDMSHYESRAAAGRKDELALARITALDPHGLYRTVVDAGITMCGFIPVTVALLAARRLGATEARLVGYTDSGETTGDISQVVGYAGLIIS